MAAAYKVSYTGPNGSACPSCVVCVASGFGECVGECVGELAAQIKQALIEPRAGLWKSSDVSIRSIEYVGPFFSSRATNSTVAFVAYCLNRHTAPAVSVFYDYETAKEYCGEFMQNNVADPSRIREVTELERGEVFRLNYASESDHAVVYRCETIV